MVVCVSRNGSTELPPRNPTCMDGQRPMMDATTWHPLPDRYQAFHARFTLHVRKAGRARFSRPTGTPLAMPQPCAFVSKRRGAVGGMSKGSHSREFARAVFP